MSTMCIRARANNAHREHPYNPLVQPHGAHQQHHLRRTICPAGTRVRPYSRHHEHHLPRKRIWPRGEHHVQNLLSGHSDDALFISIICPGHKSTATQSASSSFIIIPTGIRARPHSGIMSIIYPAGITVRTHSEHHEHHLPFALIGVRPRSAHHQHNLPMHGAAAGRTSCMSITCPAGTRVGPSRAHHEHHLRRAHKITATQPASRASSSPRSYEHSHKVSIMSNIPLRS